MRRLHSLRKWTWASVIALSLSGCSSAGSPSTDAGADLTLFLTCGDPACRGYIGDSGTPLCTDEKPGNLCAVEGQLCDPKDDCNAMIVCAKTDPRMQPARCPISRRRFKLDVRYLEHADLARYRDDLLSIRLATYRYRLDPDKERLGFMIDDQEDSSAVDARRDMVDLYGYTSMAVAAIQLQAQEIEALKEEVAKLKKRLRSEKAPLRKQTE